jgi:predicted helicase
MDERRRTWFDGMRAILEKDFDAIYVSHRGGDVCRNSKLSGTTYNVFGIPVGVSVNISSRKRKMDRVDWIDDVARSWPKKN